MVPPHHSVFLIDRLFRLRLACLWTYPCTMFHPLRCSCSCSCFISYILGWTEPMVIPIGPRSRYVSTLFDFFLLWSAMQGALHGRQFQFSLSEETCGTQPQGLLPP